MIPSEHLRAFLKIQDILPKQVAFIKDTFVVYLNEWDQRIPREFRGKPVWQRIRTP